MPHAVLSPIGTRPALLAYLRAAWARRAFLQELVSARTQAEYASSRLGPAWLLVTPLLNAALYFVVFGVLLGAGATVEDYPLFLLTGVLLYTFVSRSASACMLALQKQRDFVRTIPFPRMLLVLASMGVEVRYMAWSLLVLGAAAVLTTGVSAGWLAALAGTLLLVAFMTGCGLLLARVHAAIPDSAGLMPFVLRAGGYLSGAYFPLSAVTGSAPWLATALGWNPIAVALSAVREGLAGRAVDAGSWVLLGAWAAVAVAAGVVVFWRGEPGYGRS